MNKKISWLLLAVAMTGSVWAAETAAPLNLALGAKATDSGTGGGPPALAVDDKLSTRWESPHGYDQAWIQLDLGKAKTFRIIRLFWEDAYGKEYDLEISDDGKKWKKIHETKDGLGMLEVITLKQPVTARYFRLLGKKRATQWGYSLWEIQLFEK